MPNDSFGIKQIYPSASLTSEVYNLSNDPQNDGRVVKTNGEIITPVGGTTVTTPTPLEPTTPSTNYTVIWDSNEDGNWDNGVPRTVDDEEGDQSAGGGGFYMAASGDPRLIIDGDGVAHLEADAGHGRVYIKAINYNTRIEYDLKFEDTEVDSHSGKIRSRHQEGGSCENRFGGFGWSITRTSCGFETESCHNNHENSIDGTISPALVVGQWYRFRVEVYDNAAHTEVNFNMEIDRGSGFQTLLTGKHTSPEDYYVDKASFTEESYIWLRINNGDTASMAFRDVVLYDLDSTTTGTGGGSGSGGGSGTTVTNPDYYIVSNTPDVRLSFLTTAGQPLSANCNVNYTTLDSAGNRFNPKDWHNVEFTALFYVQTVTDPRNGIFLETRSGKKVEPRPCCDGHSLGLRVYWNDDANNDATTGRIEFSKFMHWSSSFNAGAAIVNSEIFPNFYRRWYGVKLIVYNIAGPNNEKYVKMEHWLCPSDSANDLENGWFKINEFVDTGANWGSGGALCGGTDKQAITWGSYLSTLGWTAGTEVRFKKVSVREIDPFGTFPDSTVGGDGLYNDLTIVYNINSDSDGCVCVPPPFTPPPPDPDPDPDPGGGGGGPINTNAIYDVLHTGSGVDAVHLGRDSGNSNRYLQHGIVIVGDDAHLYNKAPKRVEIPLKKQGNPNGVAYVVVRNGDTNAIETTLGTIDVTQIQTTTQYYAVENLSSSTYQMDVSDMVLLEYDENDDDDDYIIAFTKPALQNDIKVNKRDNTMSSGNYRDRNLEMSMRIFA